MTVRTDRIWDIPLNEKRNSSYVCLKSRKAIFTHVLVDAKTVDKNRTVEKSAGANSPPSCRRRWVRTGVGALSSFLFVSL